MDTADNRSITLLRLSRQCLSRPADAAEYDELFRAMSPVPCVYWSEPGSPPSLPLHTDFDDGAYNALRRSQREILKGRFGGGNIGYVDARDLELFACLYRKIPRPAWPQEELMELIRQEGPLNIGLMKELTGLLVKQITPALHKLQAAFLLFEDQADAEGDRAWYLFDEEFSDVDLQRYTPQEALCRVLPHFARLCVWFDTAMASAYYRLPQKLIASAAAQLEEEGTLVRAQTGEGQAGYVLSDDLAAIKSGVQSCPPAPQLLMLQQNDFLARSLSPSLAVRFASDWKLLYYLLLDGEIAGAVTGRFTFGPPELEDVVIELPERAQEAWREPILAAVAQKFPKAALRRYCGEIL